MNHRTQKIAGLLLLAALVAFLVLTKMAIDAYPGGSAVAGATRGYRFWQNFLSALGFTRTVTGYDNAESHRLFLIAMTVVGAGLLPTVLTAPARWFERPRFRLAGTVLGLISTVGFVLVGWLPFDLYPNGHMVGVVGGFLPWLFLSILLLIDRWSLLKIWQILLLAVLPVLVAIHGLQGIERLLTGAFTPGQPAVQKLIVGWLIVLLTYNALQSLLARPNRPKAGKTSTG